MSDRFQNWRKASKSNGGDGCVEVSFDGDGNVAFRDSKLGDTSPMLVFNAHEFDCFKDGILNGEF